MTSGERQAPARSPRSSGVAARLSAYLRLSVPFYLGLGAPGVWRRFPEGWVRAGAGHTPEFVRGVVLLYRGDQGHADGTAERVNFRCAKVTPGGSRQALFCKEFPRHHALHDLERWLRCSRVDRAWRGGHLLPRLGLLTPRPVGTAQVRERGGSVVEYLATEWIEGATPFPELLRSLGESQRPVVLSEFGQQMRGWHERGIYLRDLVKNVLVTEAEGERRYWLTDLDGLHPLRRLTRGRVLHQMRQLASWAGPLGREESEIICQSYLGEAGGKLAAGVMAGLLPPGRPRIDTSFQ